MYCRVVTPGPALHRKPAPGGQLIADTDRQQPLVNPTSFVAFSVLGGLRLQLLTICQQLVCAFCFKPLLQLGPVMLALRWSGCFVKTATTSINGRIPFFLFLVLHGADFLIFKKLQLFLFRLCVVTSF